MRSFSTLSEALHTLNQEGYTLDFNLESDCIYCKQIQQGFSPDAFTVVEYFRFEGDSDPADNSILYAIETGDGHKGTLLDAYGTYSGEISEALLQALRIN